MNTTATALSTPFMQSVLDRTSLLTIEIASAGSSHACGFMMKGTALPDLQGFLLAIVGVIVALL